MNLPTMTARDFETPQMLAWSLARCHKSPQSIPDGREIVGGTWAQILQNVLDTGRLALAGELLEGMSRGSSVEAQSLAVLSRFLISEGRRTDGGRAERLLSHRQTCIVDKARRELWYCLFARELMNAKKINEADALCFMAHMVSDPESPEWIAATGAPVSTCLRHAEQVLRHCGLFSKGKLPRDWKRLYRDHFSNHLPSDIPQSYLRGITIKLDKKV